MKKGKITQIYGEPKEYNGKYGTTYYFEIELENGDKGSIGKKSPTALSVGDEITYEITESEYGFKIKEVQENAWSSPNNQTRKATTSNNGSFALSYAKDWAIGINTGQPGAVTTDDILKIADKFKEWLDKN